MIDRRTFLACTVGGGLLAAPSGAKGQTPGNVPRVGIIHEGGNVYDVWVDGLRQGLRELDLEEGKHFVLDVRDTKGDLKVVGEAARNLERRKVASTGVYKCLPDTVDPREPKGSR